MKLIRTLDKTKSPYYVDRRFCIGKKCVYQGIMIKNALALKGKDTWKISITGRDGNKVDFQWSDLDATGMNVDTNNSMTDALEYVIKQKVKDGLLSAKLPVDIVCVSRAYIPDNIDDELGRGAIYVSGAIDIEVTGAGGSIGYIGDWANDNQPRLFYHLCANISFIFGDCRKSLSQWDTNVDSNITSANIYLDRKPPGENLRWEITDKPTILDNCNICDYCIDYCPRKAIHNRIDGTHKSLRAMDYGTDGYTDRMNIGDQVARTSRAVLGEHAYDGTMGEYPPILEIDGGVW